MKATPANAEAVQALHGILHEELLRPGDALGVVEAWLSTNLAQNWALEDRAENYFTAGRYEDADRAISALLSRMTISASNRAALLAISVANDLVAGKAAGVSAKLVRLETFVTTQPDTFSVNWLFFGTRAALRGTGNLKPTQRSELLALISALEKPRKSDVLAGIKTARNSLP